jgi:hypothetical protein
VCNDNCPQYILPNVFTPGGGLDNNCNDLFRAFGDPLLEEVSDCTLFEKNRLCARSVFQVVFTVYNRWGKKVYDYRGQVGDPDNSIYIRWNGQDNQGDDLTTGVYYYLAEVTFDVTDPSKRVQRKKGWVHIIRSANYGSSSN